MQIVSLLSQLEPSTMRFDHAAFEPSPQSLSPSKGSRLTAMKTAGRALVSRLEHAGNKKILSAMLGAAALFTPQAVNSQGTDPRNGDTKGDITVNNERWEERADHSLNRNTSTVGIVSVRDGTIKIHLYHLSDNKKALPDDDLQGTFPVDKVGISRDGPEYRCFLYTSCPPLGRTSYTGNCYLIGLNRESVAVSCEDKKDPALATHIVLVRLVFPSPR
jgi:hypothetical protein